MSRILIVDDDPAICALLERVLLDAGHDVEMASDGATALTMLVSSPPDLLITDVVMPGLAGWSVFARARRLLEALPIIVISGVDPGSPHQERALTEQAVFLRKPFNIDHLMAIVDRLLTRSTPDQMPR